MSWSEEMNNVDVVNKKEENKLVPAISAARELFSWLNKARILGFVAMGAPLFCLAASSFNFIAGGVLAIASTVAGAIIFRSVDARRKTLGLKYGFILPDVGLEKK